MPKKPKPDGSDEKDNWANDQKEREYYYDDAHGYEEYTPEAEDEDNGDESAEPKKRPQADLPDLRIPPS